MSSALTGNKIKDSYQALLKIGTNGSLDPTIPISISDGLGNDTPLQLAADKLLTNYGGNENGLKIDFANNQYNLGDFYGLFNFTYINVDDANAGIRLQSQGFVYIGDTDNNNNGTYLSVDDNNQIIRTLHQANDVGLKLDFAIKSYSFGDFNYINNGANIQIDDANRFINITSSDNFNNTRLFLDDINQIIKTSNNGNDIGIKLDFANSNYLFGDNTNTTGKSSYLELSSNAAQAAATIGIYGNALTVREYGNIWGGVQAGMQFDDAVYDNFEFNCNWEIKNDDIGKFPFYKNTIINTFGAVTTSEIAMNNNFFANNSQLSLNATVNISTNEVLSNCFVFGLTDMVDVNNLAFFSKHAGDFNTNVAILNGSGLKIGKGGNHIFSVNASGLDFKFDDNSGITILGGDVYDESSGIYVIAQHSLISGKCGINFTGQKAIGKNSFSNVFGYYNESYGTAVGQVQIEQKQLFGYYSDPDVFLYLYDTLDSTVITVPQGSNCLVEVKIVSYIGENDFNTGGNWFTYDTFMVSNDNLTNLVRVSPIENVTQHNTAQVDIAYVDTTDGFQIRVRPHIGGSFPCWVKAEVVLNKISVV